MPQCARRSSSSGLISSCLAEPAPNRSLRPAPGSSLAAANASLPLKVCPVFAAQILAPSCLTTGQLCHRNKRIHQNRSREDERRKSFAERDRGLGRDCLLSA